jgi:hypothetical protein
MCTTWTVSNTRIFGLYAVDQSANLDVKRSLLSRRLSTRFLVIYLRSLKELYQVKQMCILRLCPQVRIFTFRYYLLYLDEISNWAFFS